MKHRFHFHVLLIQHNQMLPAHSKLRQSLAVNGAIASCLYNVTKRIASKHSLVFITLPLHVFILSFERYVQKLIKNCISFAVLKLKKFGQDQINKHGFEGKKLQRKL